MADIDNDSAAGALAEKGRKKSAKKGNRSWAPAAPLGIKSRLNPPTC